MKICRERIYPFRNTLNYNYIWAERINAFPTNGGWTWMDFRVIPHVAAAPPLSMKKAGKVSYFDT